MDSYAIVFENCQLTDGKKHGDKWYPFNSVTNHGRIWRNWRKGAESIRLIRAISTGRRMDIYPFNSITTVRLIKVISAGSCTEVSAPSIE